MAEGERTVEIPVAPDEVVIREGLVSMVLPRAGVGKKRGPSHSSPVFFNPAMQLARDIMVAVFPVLPDRFRKRVLDGLAGTGVRGLRIAKECPGLWNEMTINDKHPWAYKAIQRNIALNGVDPESVRATKWNVNALVHAEDFTYIDIDPYGTVIPYIDGAIQSSIKSVLAFTTTDTAALTGTSSDALLRRYGARGGDSHFKHEAGLRTLIGAIVRHAARFDKAATPLLSHATDYYMRTYMQLWDGASRAKENLKMLGYVTMHEDGRIEAIPTADCLEHLPVKKARFWGPLWLGPIHDAGLLGRLQVPEHTDNGKNLKRLFEAFKGEAALMPMFYDLDEMARLHKPNAPKLERLLTVIRDEGYKASRAHVSPKGFKTDMPYDELVALWKKE
jgi:tRNA (guanine26-N2/guanine27-N2)-dimethyltransferase